ncbi:hypothetical protein CK203_097317 [Vitis vinifera]|uniref:DUF4283 domain-containing protein n=1 Tax=Vitis vinifera TaxID=29760 RepID=A0A438D662_VITVI|nr:hypothetical protein CK203_097317 [Vitis vinifera]
MVGFLGKKPENQEGKAMEKAVGGRSYATIAKQSLSGNPNAIVVKVKREESIGLLKKLEHCVVASWKDNSGGEDNLEKLGQLWAKSWELKGSLGLAKLEKERALLDFEDLEEARRVVSSGNRAMEGIQVGLEYWSPRSGCWAEEEERKEIWVRIVGLPVSLWSPEILKRVGDTCGGFITVDEQTKTMGELQWARILVRVRGETRPSILEVEAEEEVYVVSLWWECRPVLRRNRRQEAGRHSSEVRGEEVSRAEQRVTKECPTASPKEPRRVGGPGLMSGAMGLKMKGVAASEIGPEVVRHIGMSPIRWKAKGGPTSSAAQDQNNLQETNLLLTCLASSNPHEPEPFVARETKDMRKLHGVVRISETDKALEEESMRYGMESLYEACNERSNGCKEWEQIKVAVTKAGGWMGSETHMMPKQREETKIQAMSDSIARSIGSERFLDWKAVNAEGLQEEFLYAGIEGERSSQRRMNSAMRKFAEIVGDLGLVAPSISDHFPITLVGGGIRRGPTPFRFENMWLKVEGFKDLVHSWWQGIEVRGSASYKLATKMKEIKQN